MVGVVTIEILKESEITAALDAKIRSFLCTQFQDWACIFQQERTWHEASPVLTILALDDSGEIIGHVAIVERTITTCWNWRYTVASIQGVSVREGHRHQGIAHQLLQNAINEATKLGYLFAILFCKEEKVSFYHSQGWHFPEDSMIMWKDRDLPIHMRSNCPMYHLLSKLPFPEGPIDVHNPF